MSIVSERLSSIRPSETKAMTARAAELKRQGRDVITLSQGEPDFDTPENIRLAAVGAIQSGKTRYTAVQGIPELREAICRKLYDDNGLSYQPDQITVGCGAKQVLFNALFASLDSTSEVLIPAPCWVSYPEMVRLAGGVPVVLQTSEENGFKLLPQQLEVAITPRTRWLLLNSPCNPTGAVYSATDLDALAEVLRAHPHVHVIADDIYEKLVFSPARFATLPAVAPDLHPRTLVVNGVSKANAMTGWRVGYGAGPADLIKAMNTIQSQTSSHTSSVSQWAAVEALNGDTGYINGFVEAFQKRREALLRRLGDAPGLTPIKPDGAFYIFVKCEGIIGLKTPDGATLKTDTDFARLHYGAASARRSQPLW